MNDIKTIVGVVAYAVTISAYVFGLRGDIERLEQRLNTVNGKLQRVTNETISQMQKIEKHDQQIYFILNGCCSDMISTSVKIVNDKNNGEEK